MSELAKTSPLDTLELTSDFRVGEAQNLYQARQKSKAISKSINGQLCYLDSDIHKDYQAAYYCNDYLFQEGKKVTARFCRKRNCIVCSRIKAAEYMKSYGVALLDLPELQLVTLTAPNVCAADLDNEIDYLYVAFAKIKDNIRKNYKDLKIVGLRKLEVTYNHITDKYNPHYHIIVSGKEVADTILNLWLKQFKGAKRKGQDVRSIKDKGALIEVFKYVTKAIVKQTFNPIAVDQMYRSIKNRRTIQPMGIKKLKVPKLNTYASNEITHRSERIEVWKWCKNEKDWYSVGGEKFNDTYIDKDANKVIKIIESTKVVKYEKKTRREESYDTRITVDRSNRSCQKVEFDD